MNIELTAILVGFSLMAFALSAVSTVVACLAWSTVVGLKNSTHQVQYVPIDEAGEIPSHEAEENRIELPPHRHDAQKELHDKHVLNLMCAVL